MNIEVLKFSASWCGPCRVLANTLKDVEGITAIDIDKDNDASIVYGIRTVPTLIMLDEHDNIVKRIGGILTKEQLTEWMTI